ncbi:MAG: hypothetical protein GDA56_03810 [Hormoscilla sp. GM7CHS1pb]|nr:hypothetical protein [Hormoscilla sp. GM7CHS1pb]
MEKLRSRVGKHATRCLTLPIDLLDELKIDKCSLVGYYPGRRLGLYPICTFPSRFEKVILESATRYAGIKNRSREEKLLSRDAELAL